MEESINVIIDDQLRTKTNKEEESEENSQNELKSLENEASHDSGSESEGIDNDEVKYPKEIRLIKGYSLKDIIGDPNKGVKTRRQLENFIIHVCLTTTVETRKVKEVLNDPDWILAM